MFLVKRRNLLLSGLLVSGLAASAQKTPQKYLAQFEPVAVNLMKETGVPASVILGVAMLESGMGTSKNARLLRNHFGIVGKNNLAKRGGTYRSVYREFASDTASYRQFVKLVMKRRWYAGMKGNDDYSAWLAKLIQSGYSSAGQIWVNRVSGMIRRYKLYELDDELKLAKQ
ncbi:glucosaminidase domain-containing protein [Chitinophaga sp.]|uniref:glucosaminidase domain-containing protein n=1 Tax=Chitinophaga sp. TaxID=1869181 RepID=UPI0031D06976